MRLSGSRAECVGSEGVWRLACRPDAYVHGAGRLMVLTQSPADSDAGWVVDAVSTPLDMRQKVVYRAHRICLASNEHLSLPGTWDLVPAGCDNASCHFWYVPLSALTVLHKC